MIRSVVRRLLQFHKKETHKIYLHRFIQIRKVLDWSIIVSIFNLLSIFVYKLLLKQSKQEFLKIRAKYPPRFRP